MNNINQLGDDKPLFTELVKGKCVGLFSEFKQLMAKEESIGKVQFVEASSCVVWPGNSRDYTSLTKSRCAKLIDGIMATSSQNTPAIVRKTNEKGFEYEVICGAKRLWSVNWIRNNCVGYSSLQFLIEVRQLTDKDAFLLNDMDNRLSEDISHYERAVSYCDALEKYYPSQKQMALSLNVSESTLSRYLDLARLPKEILEVFNDTSELCPAHAKIIKRIMRSELGKEGFASKLEVLKEHKGSMSVKDTIDFLSRSTENGLLLTNKPGSKGELILADKGWCSNRVDISKKDNVLTMKLTLVNDRLKLEDMDSVLDVLSAYA